MQEEEVLYENDDIHDSPGIDFFSVNWCGIRCDAKRRSARSDTIRASGAPTGAVSAAR